MNLMQKIYKKLSLNPRARPLVFVHIPKTAGTSFRRAAQDYFGPDKTFFDYGVHSPETSALVLEYIYHCPDMYLFKNMLPRIKSSFLGGHFKALKYLPLFRHTNIIGFIRHPVQRVISHYNHEVDINGFEQDLLTFSKEKVNVQSRFVQGFPLELFGFLGLTEQYEESLNLINSIYNLDLDNLFYNANEKSSKNRTELSNDEFEHISRLNSKDMEIYSRAVQIFEQRAKMFSMNEPYTFCCVETLNKKLVSGWAFRQGSNQEVSIEITRNQTPEAVIRAVELRDNLLRFCPQRLGFIGFTHSFKKPLKPEDEVVCRVHDTGQLIPSSRGPSQGRPLKGDPKFKINEKLDI